MTIAHEQALAVSQISTSARFHQDIFTGSEIFVVTKSTNLKSYLMSIFGIEKIHVLEPDELCQISDSRCLGSFGLIIDLEYHSNLYGSLNLISQARTQFPELCFILAVSEYLDLESCALDYGADLFSDKKSMSSALLCFVLNFLGLHHTDGDTLEKSEDLQKIKLLEFKRTHQLLVTATGERAYYEALAEVGRLAWKYGDYATLKARRRFKSPLCSKKMCQFVESKIAILEVGVQI